MLQLDYFHKDTLLHILKERDRTRLEKKLGRMNNHKLYFYPLLGVNNLWRQDHMSIVWKLRCGFCLGQNITKNMNSSASQ